MKHVQFKLTDEQYERLSEQALEGESPGVTAKRLLLGIPVGKGEPVRVTGYSGTPEQIAGALAEAMGVLEEEVAEATLPSRALQQTRKNVETAGKLAGAKKKPTTTIEQERAQAAERMRAALRPKYDNGISGGWPPEMRSQDEIDFDDVPVIGAPPPEPEELPKGRRK